MTLEPSLSTSGAPARNTIESKSFLPQAAGITGCVYFLAHGLLTILGTQQHAMEWLYDDTFYYLITAKHFTEQHIASFDGVTVTSGYHPLWMWLCSLVYGLHGQLDFLYVRSCMALAFCIASGVLCATLLYAIRNRRNGMLWALGLSATSYSALNNGVAGMEWPLVILCWVLLHRLMVSPLPPSASPKHPPAKLYAALCLVGIMGSLSRTDFGLVPVCYAIGGCLIGARYRSYMFRAIVATAGAVFGLAGTLVYNHWMTGAWLQTSAEVKRQFAALTSPFNPTPAAWQFMRVLLYLPPLNSDPAFRARMMLWGIRFLLLAGLLAGALIWVHREYLRGIILRALGGQNPAENMALLASAAGLAGYMVLYGLDSQATYGWYTATVTGFILVLASRLLTSLRGPVAAVIVFPLMLCNIAAAEYWGGNAHDQTQEIAIGKRMHAEHPHARMGGGDVGKPSFYNDGTLFNLDGLMNNEVYPYLIAGRIHCYIYDRHIEYLSDIGSITEPLTDAERKKRGESPLPWSLYFPLTEDSHTSETPDGYIKTDFEAIGRSGECGAHRR